MRILKYIFLLLLLFLIGLTVFVTTQKGDYDFTQSKVIKTPRATVYNFINDYRNWETFGSWLQNDADLKVNYSAKTSGKDAFYSWKGSDSEGNIQTLALTENESIHQKMTFNGSDSEVFWTFKDTLGATKVSWRSKGKMSAIMKLKAFFKGSMTTVIGEMYEKSLANLDKTLDYEINTFNIKINGIVSRPKTFYIGQTINSYQDKVAKNTKILLPTMIQFFEKNKMVMHGKPFVKYNKTFNTIVNFSMCIPVKDSVYIMPGSDIGSGKIEAMTALKATLTGDYSHLKEAKKKAIDYLTKNNFKQNSSNSVIEVYVTTIKDIKQPSKWITELYIPVYPKAVVAKPSANKPADSTAIIKVVVPTEVPVNQ
ncbi:MAG: SRPBCC family protein [Bacteroidota bacterium]